MGQVLTHYHPFSDRPNSQTGSRGEITYSRLAELVRAQAAGLDHLAVGTGERVAVVSRSSSRLLGSFLAVAGTGRVLMPIDVRLSIRDIARVIGHSGATMLLTDPEFDNALLHGLTELRYVFGTRSDDAELYRFGGRAEGWEYDDDAIAIIEYAKSESAIPEARALTPSTSPLDPTRPTDRTRPACAVRQSGSPVIPSTAPISSRPALDQRLHELGRRPLQSARELVVTGSPERIRLAATSGYTAS